MKKYEMPEIEIVMFATQSIMDEIDESVEHDNMTELA